VQRAAYCFFIVVAVAVTVIVLVLPSLAIVGQFLAKKMDTLS